MSTPSLWERLRALLGRGGEPAPPARPGLTAGAGKGGQRRAAGRGTDSEERAARVRGLRSEEEVWLETLIIDVGERRRLSEVASEEFWQRIERIWARGEERLVTDWLHKFLATPATPESRRTPLRVRLIEFLDQRGDLPAAVPHLQALTRAGGEVGGRGADGGAAGRAGADANVIRAHYLLGEHYRRQGDEARALRHYEAVLARDVAYPNVRARVERLRAARGSAGAAVLGETIAGAGELPSAAGARYKLVRELGRGATGVVYLARDVELARQVAVKLLHPHLASARRADACARFFDEARATASLRHPNIVAVLDLDERARRIVMEWAAGGTLRTVLRERGPRPVRRALERHAQLLSALAASHRRGIVHRDIKPGNLMFRRDADAPGAEIMLGDFGVAHLPDADGATGARAAESKRPAEAVGTLAYMSPEQRAGAPADPRSDLYAAAIVLYEMLTAAPPWPRDVLLSGRRARGDLALPAPTLAAIPDRVRAPLQAHLDALGDPDPEARPDTGAALAEARELRDRAVALLSRQA